MIQPNLLRQHRHHLRLWNEAPPPPLLLCQHRPWLVNSSSNNVQYFQLLSSKYQIRHWNFLSFSHSIHAREHRSNQWWTGIWIAIYKLRVTIRATQSIFKRVYNDRAHTGTKWWELYYYYVCSYILHSDAGRAELDIGGRDCLRKNVGETHLHILVKHI